MKEKKAKKTQISIRIPGELLDQIQMMAKKERRNLSNMIEWLLRESVRGAEKK